MAGVAHSGGDSALREALGIKKLGDPKWVPSFGGGWLPE